MMNIRAVSFGSEGNFDYAIRVTVDGGSTYTYCDTNGEGNEANVYVANTAGQLVVLLDDVDECSNGQNNCSQNATCTDLTPNAVGDPGYSCACNQYYEGDGITCTDIDNQTNNGGCQQLTQSAPMLLVASGPVRVSMAIPETGSITAMNLLVIPVATVPKTVMKPALTVAVRHVARVILPAARLTRIVLVFVSSVNGRLF